jgi:hypothetical protein
LDVAAVAAVAIADIVMKREENKMKKGDEQRIYNSPTYTMLNAVSMLHKLFFFLFCSHFFSFHLLFYFF